MENKLLKVRMLGGFSLEYGGEEVSFERNAQTKVNQLLQILFHAGSDGIAREQLMVRLFGNEEITNPSNSLRATVFRLRKLLVMAGFPENDEFVHIKSGIYRWTGNIPIEVDTDLFEKSAKAALEEADEEERCLKLKKACSLYGGDFLPQLENVTWVEQESAKYKKLYKQCMKMLCQYFKSRRDYEELFQSAAEAVALYPYEEWQIWQLDSLIGRNCMVEATRLYEETADAMFREAGVVPSKRMMERLAKMSSEMPSRSEMIEAIQSDLMECEEPEGAFYCSYPSFTESYRYMKRVIQRSGQSAYLMLCTITDGKGYPLEKSERLDRISEELGDAIKGALRKGDLYTRYSGNQYLVLLLDIKQGDCRIVIDRINNNFKINGRKNYIRYNVSSLRDKEDAFLSEQN